jgi:hypothetical protein
MVAFVNGPLFSLIFFFYVGRDIFPFFFYGVFGTYPFSPLCAYLALFYRIWSYDVKRLLT